MNSNFADTILKETLATLPFEPLPAQHELLKALAEFVVNGKEREVFVLNGYAGTGKTSLVGALIRTLDRLRRRVVLLAPTGRAAKVAEKFSAHKASTIHRHIFRPNPTDPSGKSWIVTRNPYRETIFIVDEASLIADSRSYSSSSILSQLASYVYSSPGCRMILVGDEAQLPPVGQESSTAMDHDRLREIGLIPTGFSLDQPVRQAAEGGIVHNATIVRYYLKYPPEGEPPELHVSGYPQMSAISSADLADALTASFSEVGEEETLLITRSNKRANDFNRAVRNMVMYAEEPLERGDRLVISKNDYFWKKENKSKGLIANGESARVSWVGRTEKAYGRYFTEVELQFDDDSIVNAMVMLRSLVCEGPAIPRQEMERFQNAALSAYEGEYTERLKALDADPYYNALQAKYAYCVTCHKAQGGQWRHVYIDMGGIDPESFGDEFYRWLYTALTRATERVFLINPTIRII